MFLADIGDHSDLGVDDVGGIVSATHTDFDDGTFDTLPLEVQECQRGRGFEEGTIVTFVLHGFHDDHDLICQ